MSAEEDIHDALMTRLEDLPFSPPIPVAWMNDHYEPTVGQKYIEARHLPNDSERIMISGTTDRMFGILLLNLHYPLNRGQDEPLSDIGTIIGLFPTDQALESGDTRLRVTRRPVQKEGINIDGWWVIPILVHYEAFV